MDSAFEFGVLGLIPIVPWPKALIFGMALQLIIVDILTGIVLSKFYQSKIN